MSWMTGSETAGGVDESSPFAAATLAESPFAADYTPFASDEVAEAIASWSPETGFHPTEELELEPRYVPEAEDESSAIVALRTHSRSTAKAEFESWNRGGQKKETDPAMRPRLLAYWQTVTTAAEAERMINRRDAWSAAFISYVMKQAGAGTSFKYGAAHRIYIGRAKAARLAGEAGQFW